MRERVTEAETNIDCRLINMRDAERQRQREREEENGGASELHSLQVINSARERQTDRGQR